MGQRLDHISDALLIWMITTSLQLSILGMAIAVVDRILEHRVWPQIRAALWWLLIASLVVGPLVQSPVSIWRVNDAVARWGESIVRGNSPQDSLASVSNGNHDAPVIGSTRSLTTYGILCAWITGAMILLLMTHYRTARINRRWLSDNIEVPIWLQDSLHRAAARIGVKHPPRLVISDTAPGPALLGAIRSTVVLPAALLEKADREQIEHILMHELAHVRRRDALASRFCHYVQVIFWFHPVVRLARKQLDTLREIGCDETVARAMHGDAESYRRTLLIMARALLDSPSPAAVAFMHHHSQIMARLAYLDKPLTNHPRTVRGAAAIVFALSLVCCIPQVQSLAPRLEPTITNLADWPGCMQLRFAVMRAMAEKEAQESGV